MGRLTRLLAISVSAVIFIGALWLEARPAGPHRVLVVMSYEETFPWCKEIKSGIDAVLKESAEITYFYMNTKTHFKGGPEKAREAYALYEQINPDGVIAADDNAQSMFVVPYLKDKVLTPVMFCGVNAPAGEYGYPASNVSGILERHHIRESIAFVKLLVPQAETMSFIMKAGPSAHHVRAWLLKGQDQYLVRMTEFRTPTRFKGALQDVKELAERTDVLFIETLQGVTDAEGNPVPDSVAIPRVVKEFGKATVGANTYAVVLGVLCAVVKTGQEQGRTAAEMLLKAMEGTPVSGLSIKYNRHGKRVVNVDTLGNLGIKPKSIILRGSELVKTNLNVEK